MFFSELKGIIAPKLYFPEKIKSGKSAKFFNVKLFFFSYEEKA